MWKRITDAAINGLMIALVLVAMLSPLLLRAYHQQQQQERKVILANR